MYAEIITDKAKILEFAPKYETWSKHEKDFFIFVLNNVVVGVGEMKIDEDRDLEIRFIEIFDKGRGYGRIFVDHLRLLPNINTIWGESKKSAISFWEKVGVTFNSESLEYVRNCDEWEADYSLVPFTVNK